MQESLIPVGPPKKSKKAPRPPPAEQGEAGPSTSENNGAQNVDTNNNCETNNTERIPMLIRGIGVHQVIPKEATRDVLSGKVPFYLVDDRDGVTLFPAKHIFTALRLDKEHVEKFEDYTCLGGHERGFEKKPKRRQGMGYRRRYISPELLNRGVYCQVSMNIRIKALMLDKDDYE